MPNINELLHEKNQIIEQLNSIIFGSIELRDKDGKDNYVERPLFEHGLDIIFQ